MEVGVSFQGPAMNVETFGHPLEDATDEVFLAFPWWLESYPQPPLSLLSNGYEVIQEFGWVRVMYRGKPAVFVVLEASTPVTRDIVKAEASRA